MSEADRVQVFDSQGEPYHRALQVFLDHTDQKAAARARLDRLVAGLPARRVFIDAGAGNGKVTQWFTDDFRRTIAVEPNPFLRDELKRACPDAEVLPEAILEAKPSAAGDLVLCSHVFYYVDGADWPASLERLGAWLSPEGLLVVILQNPETDCMQMLDSFMGRRFDLRGLARHFEAEHSGRYAVTLETVPAHVTTPDFESAYTVAEFMLNLLPLPHPPPRRALEDYVRTHFRTPVGGFRFSCHQDFLEIRRRR
jgi:hypothetical protein